MIDLYNLCTDLVDFENMAFPPRDQRNQYLRFEGLYTVTDIADFETRLGKIYRRKVHRVQVFDFGGLTNLMATGLSGRMLMEHRDAQGHGVFISRAWRRLFEIRGLLVHELILEFFSTFRFGEVVADLDMAEALQFYLKTKEAVAAGAPKAAKDAPVVDKDAPTNPTPMQAPHPPHAAPRTMPQRIVRLEEEVHELR
ncbi:hypothetical protein Tco_1177376 [Tanacetum coccineum]